jgi:hypothetical protein
LKPRGAAITELALILPVITCVLLFGLYFGELMRAKLKLLELSRYVTWELTSYTLTDYGQAKHDQAFNEAWSKTKADASRRFKDLDSVDDRPSGNFIAGLNNLTLAMDNEPVKAIGNFSTQANGAVGGPFMAGLLSVLNGSLDQLYQHFRFNTKGQAHATVSIELESRLVRQQTLKLTSSCAMIATGWQLPDGADANMRGGSSQAGMHDAGSIHGMWLQVNRMTHLGVTQDIEAVRGLQMLLNILRIFLPQPFTSTYVVAHNYGLADGDPRQCASGPGNHDVSHEAKDGLNNLGKDSDLDWPWRKCYDTAPFRDVAGYDTGGDRSLYVKQFEERGAYFMGCKNPQADDPTFANNPPTSRGDRNTKKVDCE